MTFQHLIPLALLTLSVNAATVKRVACPDGVNHAINPKCCAFMTLRDDLLNGIFDERTCSEEVHEVLRLSFHDAIGFSPLLTSEGKFGGTGADGSFLLFPNVEPLYHSNNGTGDTVDDLVPIFSRHNVSAGDLIQFAAATGLTLCPGAPRVKFLAGRKNAAKPPPDGLVPEPFDSVQKILARFLDATKMLPNEVVALLASHSIARADHVDPSLDAAPFDTTPFTFDTQFFLEVQLRGVGFPGGNNNTGEVASPLPQGEGEDVGELRLQSDANFARNPLTACHFQSFVNNQKKMRNEFKAAFEKLAITGQALHATIDCTEALPPQAPDVTKPATFPAGKSNADVEQACHASPFPTLSSDPGPATVIPHCPNGETDCDS